MSAPRKVRQRAAAVAAAQATDACQPVVNALADWVNAVTGAAHDARLDVARSIVEQLVAHTSVETVILTHALAVSAGHPSVWTEPDPRSGGRDRAAVAHRQGRRMRRADVEASRHLAARYVKACDELLATTARHYEPRSGATSTTPWRDTWQITGKATGAHRRLSLDLTRALAHMRRRG